MVDRNDDLCVVVGLGKTGLSCIRYLRSIGHTVAVVDSRPEPPDLHTLKNEFPDIEVHLGDFESNLMDRANTLVVSPGVSLKQPAIARQAKRKVTIVGDIELFATKTTKPVVGITGSNGKSTVTSLVGHLASEAGLRVKVGGNIGVPALELLDDANTDLYVLELSSFQLETTHSLNCASAVNLNISPDHMDRYDNLQEYIDAKLRIYRKCQKPIVNLDDPQSYSSFSFNTPPVGFTLKEPEENVFGLRWLNGEAHLACGNTSLLATKNLLLKGQHQYANVLAALAIGSSLNLPMDGMLNAVIKFKGLPHRCQWLAKINGIDWYNDSKATNVGSAEAAITGIGSEISGKLILLAGGQGKNANFSELYKSVSHYVKTLILFGEDKHIIAKALNGAAETLITNDLAEAVNLAAQHASSGDVVILSPACASFDMFRNFEHRGEVFMKLVSDLQA